MLPFTNADEALANTCRSADAVGTKCVQSGDPSGLRSFNHVANCHWRSGVAARTGSGPAPDLPRRCSDGLFSPHQESFARAKSWVKELQRQASPNIVIALSGNKADLASKRAVDFQVSRSRRAFTLCSLAGLLTELMVPLVLLC